MYSLTRFKQLFSVQVYTVQAHTLGAFCCNFYIELSAFWCTTFDTFSLIQLMTVCFHAVNTVIIKLSILSSVDTLLSEPTRSNHLYACYVMFQLDFTSLVYVTETFRERYHQLAHYGLSRNDPGKAPDTFCLL